jgi:hypothetical protein
MNQNNNIKDVLFDLMDMDDATEYNRIRKDIIDTHGYEYWSKLLRQVLLRKNAQRYDFLKLT